MGDEAIDRMGRGARRIGRGLSNFLTGKRTKTTTRRKHRRTSKERTPGEDSKEAYRKKLRSRRS